MYVMYAFMRDFFVFFVKTLESRIFVGGGPLLIANFYEFLFPSQQMKILRKLLDKT